MDLLLKRPTEQTKDNPRKWWQYIISLVINDVNTKHSKTLKDYIFNNNLDKSSKIKTGLSIDDTDEDNFLSYLNQLESIGIPINVIKEHALLIKNSSFVKNLKEKEKQEQRIPLLSLSSKVSSSNEDLLNENNILRGNLVMLAAIAYSMTENIIPPILISTKDENEVKNNDNDNSFLPRSSNTSDVSPIELVDESVSDIGIGIAEIDKNDFMFKNFTTLHSDDSNAFDKFNTTNNNSNDDKIIENNTITTSDRVPPAILDNISADVVLMSNNEVEEQDKSKQNTSPNHINNNINKIKINNKKQKSHRKTSPPRLISRLIPTREAAIQSEPIQAPELKEILQPNTAKRTLEQYNPHVNSNENVLKQYNNIDVTGKENKKNNDSVKKNGNNKGKEKGIFKYVKGLTLDHPNLTINNNIFYTKNNSKENVNLNTTTNNKNNHSMPIPPTYSPPNSRPLSDGNFERIYNIGNRNMNRISDPNPTSTSVPLGLELDLALHGNYGLQPNVYNNKNDNNMNMNMIQFPSMHDLTLAAHARPFIDSSNVSVIKSIPPKIENNENINNINNDYNLYNDIGLKPYNGLNRPIPTDMQLQMHTQVQETSNIVHNNNLHISNNNDYKAKSIIKYLKNHPPLQKDLEFQYEPVNPKMFEMKLPWLDRRGKSTSHIHKRNKHKKKEFSAAADKYRILQEDSPRENKYSIEKIDMVLDKYKYSQKRHAEFNGEAHHTEIQNYREEEDYDSIGSHSTVKHAVKAIANGRAFHSGNKEFRTRPLQPLEKELFGSFYARSLLTGKQKKITKSALFQAG